MDSDLPSDAPVPRLCHLIKWPSFDGYGFNLQLGQFIGKVDDESPAQYADLREGDRIIEVNGVSISNENHKQVVQRIKQIPNETRLLVIDQNEYNWYKERDLVIKSTQSNIKHCKTPVPRPSAKVNNNYYYYNHDDDEQQQQQISTANTSLSSNNETTSINNEIQTKDPLTNEILNELETKEEEIKLNGNEQLDELSIKLESTNLESTKIEKNDTSSTIESNNNSEKAANQNLVSPIKNSTPAKTHNFIVVNSEEQFAAEKRLKKDEQMKNNSTPIRKELNNHNHLNINNISTSNLSSSSSNHNQSNNSLSSDIDINLNMSVSEMRKIIASRKNVKQECKKPTFNLRQKYEIIQQM